MAHRPRFSVSPAWPACHALKRTFWTHTLLTASLALALAASPARAQSEASLVLSAGGAVLVVKAVEVTARGTVLVLERVSDGARASVALSGRAASEVEAGVGSVVAVSVIGTGVLLSVAGEVLCFIPNELGRALLHNERITD